MQAKSAPRVQAGVILEKRAVRARKPRMGRHVDREAEFTFRAKLAPSCKARGRWTRGGGSLAAGPRTVGRDVGEKKAEDRCDRGAARALLEGARRLTNLNVSGDQSAWRRLSESLVEVGTIEVPEVETPSETPSGTDGDASDPPPADRDVDLVPEL